MIDSPQLQSPLLAKCYTETSAYSKISMVPKKPNYLFCSQNPPIMVAMDNLLRLGCTLCPAFLTVIPRIRTWSITVSRISSEINALGLALPCPPPFTPCLTCTLPLLPLRLFPSIVGINLQSSPVLPVHSELAYIGFITSISTSVNNFELSCPSHNICAVIAFNFCHLWLALWITNASQCKTCFSEWECV